MQNIFNWGHNMQYREFGNTGIWVSAAGMGTSRFPFQLVQTSKGIEQCAQMVVQATNAGINFFDSASTYSAGHCEEILRLALPHVKSEYHICGKSSCYEQQTSDSLLRHLETSLKNIGIEYFDFYYMWNVKSWEQFEFIISPGGPYEGALEAKRKGLIRHICFSSHAPVADAIKIIESGLFEGITISYSLLNVHENEPVLRIAKQNGLGVSIMNPLGGGIIPQNPTLFEGCVLSGDKGVADAALKFVYANDAVSTILCGISTPDELDSNISSLNTPDLHTPHERRNSCHNLNSFSAFCTGCNYCKNCPSNIPISKLMSAYNQTKFNATTCFFNRASSELIKYINFFKQLDGIYTFKTSKNPCIKCRKCEKICTQNLPITQILDEIYSWVGKTGASIDIRKERLRSLLPAHYKRVGFYTAGFYTSFVIDMYKKFFGNFPFEVYIFDSNPQKWGQTFLESFCIRPPSDISKLSLDIVLISNYIHSDSIYKDLTKKYSAENIQKLHQEFDIPWTF